MTRILVTGGCGFIGSHVVDLLLHKGHEIMVVDNGDRAVVYGKDNVLLRIVELRDYTTLRMVFDEFKPQVVMHLAGDANMPNSSPITMLATNILGTVNVLLCCKELELKTFIFASTAAVYADSKKAILEDGKLADPGTPYGISKRAAEQYVRYYLPEAVILRLGNVYGPRQGMYPNGENKGIAGMMRHLKYMEPFHILGDGKQERDHVYVEDVARAFHAAMTGKAGVYNISWGSNPASANECAEMIADLYGFPGYEWKHDWKRQDPHRCVWLDNTKAAVELHWEPKVRLLDGLQKTIEWWNERE